MKKTINFEDFKKLDIRIGQIISVKRVPETDKLYAMSVDFDTESRTIVSGIAPHISESDLIGKICPFILNLEPRIIRGVESNGMILAVSNEDQFALLCPLQPIKVGSEVR